MFSDNDKIISSDNHQIAICQDGMFAATFDSANQIRILKNTDYRPFEISKEKKKNDQKENKKDTLEIEIDDNSKTDDLMKTIAKFTIDNVYHHINTNNGRWSLGISNVQKYQHEYFILVAVSRIDVCEDMKDMKGTHKKNDKCSNCNDYQKGLLKKFEFRLSSASDDFRVNVLSELKKGTNGTAIYRLKLKKEPTSATQNGAREDENYILDENTAVACYYSDSVSGICKFVEDSNEDLDSSNNNVGQEKHIKRFIILNFHGIYNFKFDDGFHFLNVNEKFSYPTSIRREFNNWYTEKDCMDRLLACIYDKYFFVKQNKDFMQSFEVYNMIEMTLKTIAKNENTDKHITKQYHNVHSVSKIHFCCSQENTIKLYVLENGLEIASKTFDEMNRIYSLEFIDNDEKLLIIYGCEDREDSKLKILVWDIYNTGKVEKLDELFLPKIKDLGTRLARTSGNILQVDGEGKVTSVCRKLEYKLKQIQSKEANKLKEYSDKKLAAKLVENPDGKLDENHIIYFDKSVNFKSIIVDEKEPWMMNEYKRTSYCLYQTEKGTETETLQLIVGRSTVQIWHQIHDKSKKKNLLPNNGEPFLEYIWTNGISVNQEREETRLRVEEFKYEFNDIKLIDFYLKVYWYERNSNEKVEKDNGKENAEEESKEIGKMEKEKMKTEVEKNRKVKVIKQKDIIEKANAVRHACKALEHFNKRYMHNFFENNYIGVHQYEEIVTYIEIIIRRFVKHESDQFKLLDIRYNVMKNLILGDCNHLIKFILFGDEKDDKKGKHKEEGEKEFKAIHIPRNIPWPGKKFLKDDDLNLEDGKIKNNMELAIYHCKGRELKDTIIVAYLLEYYSRHATDCVGWMCTVSKGLPLLFKYNYDVHVKKLFRKECFADQDHFSAQDPEQVIPKEYLERRNNNIKFRSFRPIIKLQSDKLKWYIWTLNLFKSFKNKIVEFFENFDNHLGKSPLALRVVPLSGFTNSIQKKKSEYNFTKIILNILWFIFIPRWYKCRPRWSKIDRDEENNLSPFSRVILYENNDDIYDNPATEAVIDFCWSKARNFFFFLFLRFLIFASCFILLIGVDPGEVLSSYKFQLALVIFYYLAIYLLATELIQLYYHGPRKYFGDIFNFFDIASIVLPVIMMSIRIGIIDPYYTVDIIIGISFSVLLLWVELISYLRLISKIAIYIYYAIIITKAIYPFIFFITIVIIAFAHTMFALLRDSNDFITIDTTFSGVAINPKTNDALEIYLQSSFNTTDPIDNPFSSFFTAVVSAYSNYWMGNNWINSDHFDIWAIDFITLIAGIFLGTILQNMLIAFMSGVYERAEIKGRQTLLRYKANKIADYEALHHIHLWQDEPEPEYIYYIGQSRNFEEWYESRKDENAIYKDFEKKSTFSKLKRNVKKTDDYDKFSIWNFNNHQE